MADLCLRAGITTDAAIEVRCFDRSLGLGVCAFTKAPRPRSFPHAFVCEDDVGAFSLDTLLRLGAGICAGVAANTAVVVVRLCVNATTVTERTSLMAAVLALRKRFAICHANLTIGAVLIASTAMIGIIVEIYASVTAFR